MVRFAFTTAAVLLLLNPSAGQAQANPFIFLGGGITIPMGDFDDAAKSGWMGTAGFGVSVGTGKLAIGAEGYYGRNSFDGPSEDAMNFVGGAAWLAYRLGQPGRVAPYLIGSLGFLAANFDPELPANDVNTDTELAWSGGAGVDIPLSSSVSLYVEGRYMGRGDIKLIPIFAGLSFSFGGGGGT